MLFVSVSARFRSWTYLVTFILPYLALIRFIFEQFNLNIIECVKLFYQNRKPALFNPTQTIYYLITLTPPFFIFTC